MTTQVHNIIVSTLEASETMLEEVDPDSDSDELRIELMAVALNPIAAMGGGTKEHFVEMAKNAAKEYLDGTMRMTPSEPAQRTRPGGLLCRLEKTRSHAARRVPLIRSCHPVEACSHDRCTKTRRTPGAFYSTLTRA
jgi:hypothetical protein